MVYVFPKVHKRNFKVLDEFTVDQTRRIRIFLTDQTYKFLPVERHLVKFESFELQEALLNLMKGLVLRRGINLLLGLFNNLLLDVVSVITPKISYRKTYDVGTNLVQLL